MKSPPWLTPWRVACVIAGGALGCSALAQPPSIRTPASAAAAVRAATEVRPTMAQALDAAWTRSLYAVEARGRQTHAQAELRPREQGRFLLVPAAPPLAKMPAAHAQTGMFLQESYGTVHMTNLHEKSLKHAFCPILLTLYSINPANFVSSV